MQGKTKIELNMKKFIPLLSSVVLFTACNSNAPVQADGTTTKQEQAPAVTPLDTAGLAEYHNWKALNELEQAQQQAAPVVQAPTPQKRTVNQTYTPAPKKRVVNRSVAQSPAPAPKSTESSQPADNSTAQNDGGGSVSSESSQPAKAEEKKKKGMSTATKGAVIGAATGAAAGAVIAKKNRVAGAVIGGVIGSVGGHVIGKKIEKKDSTKQ